MICADYVVMVSCIILVGLFSIQHHGTHRVAFMFAPVVAAWLLCISGIGIYNIFHWNPQVYRALSPVYMLRFLKTNGIEGWMSLSGVVLSITGTYNSQFYSMKHWYRHGQQTKNWHDSCRTPNTSSIWSVDAT